MKKLVEIYICDVCGEEIKGEVQKGSILAVIDGKPHAKEIDMCNDCHKNIIERYGLLDEEEQAEEAKEEPIPAQKKQAKKETSEEPKKKKTRFDHGKAKALRKAGWKNKDIAEDLGVNRSTIDNFFYREKQKEQEQQWLGEVK